MNYFSMRKNGDKEFFNKEKRYINFANDGKLCIKYKMLQRIT